MRRAWLCAFLVAASCIPARAGNPGGDPDSLGRRGIASVYNLEFENAQKDFQELIRRSPGDPAGYFFQAMVRWWMIMIDIDDTKYDAEFYAALDGVIAMCDSLLDRNRDDVNAIFFKGGAIGFEGRLKFHRNDYLGAANAGRKALPLVQEMPGDVSKDGVEIIQDFSGDVPVGGGHLCFGNQAVSADQSQIECSDAERRQPHLGIAD